MKQKGWIIDPKATSSGAYSLPEYLSLRIGLMLPVTRTNEIKKFAFFPSPSEYMSLGVLQDRPMKFSKWIQIIAIGSPLGINFHVNFHFK
jgi:hypothetical protein